MRVLITGICGFVGSTLALELLARGSDITVSGIDNLSRPGSEVNRARLRASGIRMVHGDVRCASDLDNIGPVDWVIDAAANASVLAGVDGATSPRQLAEHNLLGTLNVLELCRRHGAGLILLSSSRVYTVSHLRSIPLAVRDNAYVLADGFAQPGLSECGIGESFPVGAPASLYGTTKLASEQLALEYGETFGFPVWIDRCGVLAGAGQFGQPAQGIFAWWIHRWVQRKPLKYIGFEGRGLQVRDCLHPADLAALLAHQLGDAQSTDGRRIFNVAGGSENARSLAQLSAWCRDRLGPHVVESSGEDRAYDVPWVVLDSGEATRRWGWAVERTIEGILDELADHAEAHPEWLALSEG